MTDLVAIARSFFAPGKGILAADESVHTATERLASVGVPASEEMRKKYRELFFGADGIEEYLSGIILFEETLGQSNSDGKPFAESLAERGIAPGIKVDEGTEPFPDSPQELISKGLLDLPKRLETYKKQGAVFTKWRAVFRIEGDLMPSSQAIHENAKRLAQYAKDVQMAGLIPIVEPEVLYEGHHGRAKSRKVLEQVLGALFAVLDEQAVDISTLVLKSAMTLSGHETGKIDTPDEVAEDTVAALIASVPKELSGIVFLSGGQTSDQAIHNLAAISHKAHELNAPWPLSFSYARALQEDALKAWQGKEENVPHAREVFIHRLKQASAAVRGL
jgi:fructose-bisphosphate aldolase, class I